MTCLTGGQDSTRQNMPSYSPCPILYHGLADSLSVESNQTCSVTDKIPELSFSHTELGCFVPTIDNMILLIN